MIRVHLAGPLIDGVQECARCGAILTDYRGAMTPTADAILGALGWPEGAHVEVGPNYAATTDDQATCWPQEQR
jgi:hypothetical protein